MEQIISIFILFLTIIVLLAMLVFIGYGWWIPDIETVVSWWCEEINAGSSWCQHREHVDFCQALCADEELAKDFPNPQKCMDFCLASLKEDEVAERNSSDYSSPRTSFCLIIS